MKKIEISDNVKLMLYRKVIFLLFISIFFLIVISIVVTAPPPTPHNIEGRVFTNGSNGVQNGIPVAINDTVSNDYVLTYTDAPDVPDLLGSYSATINGNDGGLIIVTAWNSTHYGTNSSTLISPTTNVNVVLNLTRGSETNVTILTPANNSLKNVTNVFNVTANVTILGNDGTNCNATISFSNNVAINITQDQNFTNLLDNVALGNSKLTTWNVTALSEGTFDVIVYAQCSSDGVLLDKVNRYTLFIKINDTAPIVNSSLNNTAPKYGEVINFTANVSDEIGLSFCQFIDNQSANGAKGFFNKTISGFSDQCSQDFIVLRDGGVINFSLIVNNTANFKKQKEFIITLVGIPPRWQLPEINNSNVEQADFVMFNATWTDNLNLSAYIFSSNATGYWVNHSNVSFSGAINVSNYTMQINASPGTVVGWIFHANDTFNNFNNTDAQTFMIVAQYHVFYGNIHSDIILDTASNFSIIAWINSTVKGNVYAADSDTLNGIAWTSLQAIGKDTSLNDVGDDWADIDLLLGMTYLNDSINRTYTIDEKPKNKADFIVHGYTIPNVSIVNSTNTSNFVTGILWDTSDSGNSEYDTSDKEDLVFVTKFREKEVGLFGAYHYEIKVPARLKQYRVPNNKDSISFYFELI